MLHGHVAPAPSLAAPRLCSQGLAQWVVLLSDNFAHPFTVSHEHFYWLVSAVPTLYHERADTLTQEAWDCSPQRGRLQAWPGAAVWALGLGSQPPAAREAHRARAVPTLRLTLTTAFFWGLGVRFTPGSR